MKLREDEAVPGRASGAVEAFFDRSSNDEKITAEADRFEGEARRAFIVQRIEELERSAVTL